MSRRTVLTFVFAVALSLGAAFAHGKKHHATLKDVNYDLDQVADHIDRASTQIPPGTLVALQLSMAKQSLTEAKKKLAEVAPCQQKEVDSSH